LAYCFDRLIAVDRLTPAAVVAIVKCPAGTVAMAIDANGNGNGNGSTCASENSSGETCQAYNDANQCTAWAKP
jgi:hypothetical protein